ncbi:MAG: hypothetical protein JXM68_11070 [Sedimentisphaerales bacterium]|nr:hypothetical protein [Sedimentisphaerales bacterium]
MVYAQMIYGYTLMLLTLVLLIGLIIFVVQAIKLLGRVDGDITMRAKMRAKFAEEIYEIIPSLQAIARHHAGSDAENETDKSGE